MAETETLGEAVYIRAQKIIPGQEGEESDPQSRESQAESEIPPETEAPQALPYGLVREGARWYYYAEPGRRFRGWIRTEEGYSYFNEARVEGLVRIDGDIYYFPQGVMHTGTVVIRGVEMVFDGESGRRVSARQLYTVMEDDRNLQGVVGGVLYERGQIMRGYVRVEGKWYLTDEEGLILTGKQLHQDKWYYFTPEGPRAEGFIEDPSGEAYFAGEDGTLQGGFVMTEKGLRYFDPESLAMVRNAFVGSFRIDGNGRCSKVAVEVTEANLDAYVDSILAEIGRTPRGIYDYVCENYIYMVQGWDTERNMAIYMFNNGYGACIHFCAITEMLLNRCGHATQWVRGEEGHYWLLVEMSPGVWRHMDTMRKNHHVFNLTDDELWAKHDGPYGIVQGVNFHWDRTKWTSTTTTGQGGGPEADPPAGTEPETETETEPKTGEAETDPSSDPSESDPKEGESLPEEGETPPPTEAPEEESEESPEETEPPTPEMTEERESEGVPETPEETEETPEETLPPETELAASTAPEESEAEEASQESPEESQP